CWSDPSLAFEELKWKATKTLDDMVMDAWKWQKNNS
ncbi:UDP-glucose 4-epimerase GalE, partial [Escherichia coli]